ncbi:coatomer epsilon subunit-domain-containing protein [Penicillium malachiteum]|uniref:coatomer epsilon subunit-domain-containing protein n=1 Tax=Penicillium malachiteum TaxID=1324776 RepID=UPI00254774EE|nr:coatomer epsilon subunit-domain-containing protein [Penicillium malachiteum]KAJ5729135.1 coatomer epsilon subunit-domain-containing protein [Penicillium malachiteum]
MDPFSAEGGKLNMLLGVSSTLTHPLYRAPQHPQCLPLWSIPRGDRLRDRLPFPENQLPARVLKLRSRIALGQTDEVLAAVSTEEDTPDLAAVKALALQVTGKADDALQLAQDLAENYPENATVEVLAATVLQAQEQSEEALSLLSKHQGNLEAVALIVQIQLQQNRSDLALKEVQAAKRWAQDSLLVNLAESWLGLRVGGEQYQSAFYVYEELASAPSTAAALSIVGQAVAEIHLGRLPEAEAALTTAMEKYPEDAELIANTIVLNVLSGKPTADLESRLQQAQPSHALLTDIEEKSALFDTAAAKYAPKVSS